MESSAIVSAIDQLLWELVCKRQMQTESAAFIKILRHCRGYKPLEFIAINIEGLNTVPLSALLSGRPKIAQKKRRESI